MEETAETVQLISNDSTTLPEGHTSLISVPSVKHAIPLSIRAGIAQLVQQLPKGWTTEGSEFESRWGQEFSLLHIVQTASGAHPASYQMGMGGLFTRG
jgi:hypothetical protein